MTWALMFIAVAGIAGLFGFGVLASASVAQAIAILFLLLGVIAVGFKAARGRDNRSQR